MGREQRVNNKLALQPFKTAITRYLRSQITLQGLSYPLLAQKLADRGIEITADHLRNKISRGLVPADLFVVLLQELGGLEGSTQVVADLAEQLAAEQLADED